MSPLNWEEAFATGHVLAAVSALLIGAAVFLWPKGTQTHRAIGAVYVLALVLVNVAALSLHRENTFGMFHSLAVASLVTIVVGLSPLLLGKRSPPVIATHAYCMAWSYAGLVAVGCGQLAAAVGHGDGAWTVPVVIGTCCRSAPSSSSGKFRQSLITSWPNDDPEARSGSLSTVGRAPDTPFFAGPRPTPLTERTPPSTSTTPPPSPRRCPAPSAITSSSSSPEPPRTST